MFPSIKVLSCCFDVIMCHVIAKSISLWGQHYASIERLSLSVWHWYLGQIKRTIKKQVVFEAVSVKCHIHFLMSPRLHGIDVRMVVVRFTLWCLRWIELKQLRNESCFIPCGRSTIFISSQSQCYMASVKRWLLSVSHDDDWDKLRRQLRNESCFIPRKGITIFIYSRGQC